MSQQTSLSTTPTPSAVLCPGCGYTVDCRDAESSAYFACQHCNTYFKYDGQNDAPEVLKKFYPNEVIIPTLSIGSSGILEGKEFTVLAFIVKHDATNEATWQEYLLSSPDEPEYYALAESGGHWSFIWKIDTEGFDIFNVGTKFNPEYEARTRNPFRRFGHSLSYTYEIPFAAGEFSWNILDDVNNLKVEEFVAAPDTIVSEETFYTKNWYQGKYVDKQQIAASFGLPLTALPKRNGPGVLEIPNYQKQLAPLWRFTLLMVGLVILVQTLVSLGRPSEIAFKSTYTISRDTAAWASFKPIVSESFELKQPGAVNVDVAANVNNDWMELSISLVNDKTGTTYEFTKVLEMYHGFDEGESWSEGSNSENAVFSNVPQGQYHLNIYPFSESTNDKYVEVSVEQNTIFYSNIVWMLLLLLIYPCIQYMRKSARDSQLGN